MNEQQTAKFLNLLGLAMCAGKLVSGEDEIEKSVRKGRISLLVLAADISDGTRKRYTDLAAFYHVCCITLSVGKAELGYAIGKNLRAAVAVGDPGFGKACLKLVDSQGI